MKRVEKKGEWLMDETVLWVSMSPFHNFIHILFIPMSVNVCDAVMVLWWFVVVGEKETEW